MKIFISGGCKSGKSAFAQRLSQMMQRNDAPLYYIATMASADREDEARIIRHRQEREGLGFETVEAFCDVFSVAKKCDRRASALLDSITALLSNEMYTRNGNIKHYAHKKVADDLTKLSNWFNDVVFVSDFIYSDAIIYDDSTEAFRRGLAIIDKRMAEICDVVLEACGGIYIKHKGGDFLGELSYELC